MDHQYKNGGKTSCAATGIRAQHVTDHTNFRQHTGISVTHKISGLESSSLYVKVKNGKFSVCTPLRSRGGLEVSNLFTPRLLVIRKRTRYPLNMGLDELNSQYWRFGREVDLLTTAEIRSLDSPARSSDPIPTRLAQTLQVLFPSYE
jgi:hypothetical protein